MVLCGGDTVRLCASKTLIRNNLNRVTHKATSFQIFYVFTTPPKPECSGCVTLSANPAQRGSHKHRLDFREWKSSPRRRKMEENLLCSVHWQAAGPSNTCVQHMYMQLLVFRLGEGERLLFIERCAANVGSFRNKSLCGEADGRTGWFSFCVH